MTRNTTNKLQRMGLGKNLQQGNASGSGRGHGRITAHDINNPKPNRAARRAMASSKIKRGDA